MGLFLVIAAGALNGSYALPMKKTDKWAFENVWLVYSVVAMGVVNWAIAKEAALAQGASAGAESDAIWALALTGSLVVNGVYCCVLLTRNGSWRRFGEHGTGHYWLLAALMGLVWMSSITLYGRGASAMGPLGGSVGWAVFYGCIIVFSTLWGIVCGEWRAGHGRPMRTLAAGLEVLLLAIVILGYGNSLAAER